MQSQLKVLAPVMTRDVTLPNSSKKVPMVMVPVPDSKTLMAIPLSTINNMTGVKDEQQAKDILNWNDDGIGTLDGCDLRFKINQLGCLELVDSGDEEEYDQAGFASYQHMKSKSLQQQQHRNYPDDRVAPNVKIQHSQSKQANSHHQDTNDHISTNSTKPQNHQNNHSNKNYNSNYNSSSSSNNNNTAKKAKIKQISPGCSLLRDGPDNRRARAPSSTSTQSSTSNMPLSTRRTESTTNLVLLEKLIPKKQIDKLKSKVENWSVEDVKSFVDGLPGCAGLGHLFESQQICGKSLLYLDQKDLVDIVNVKLGPAIKIYNVISLIKS